MAISLLPYPYPGKLLYPRAFYGYPVGRDCASGGPHRVWSLGVHKYALGKEVTREGSVMEGGFAAAWIAGGIVILLAIITSSVAFGRLFEKVRGNHIDINDDRKANREDHTRLFDKMDELRTLIINGGGKT